MAQLIYTYLEPPRQKDIDLACHVLDHDGIVALATESNWLFAFDPGSHKAVQRIRLLKPYHSKYQPFSLLVSDIAMASTIANIDNSTYRFLKKNLPGAYTIILPGSRGLAKNFDTKRKAVGIRVPKRSLAIPIVQSRNRPLAITSVPKLPANKAFNAGEQSPHFGYEIEEAFGHGIDLILDLGEECSGSETTIIDFFEEKPKLIRLGQGSIEGLELELDEDFHNNLEA